MLKGYMSQLIPERKVDPAGLRGGFLDAEAGPRNNLPAAKMLDLDGRPYDSDQTDRIGELLPPGDLLGPRVDHPRVLVVRIAAARASDGE